MLDVRDAPCFCQLECSVAAKNDTCFCLNGDLPQKLAPGLLQDLKGKCFVFGESVMGFVRQNCELVCDQE